MTVALAYPNFFPVDYNSQTHMTDEVSDDQIGNLADEQSEVISKKDESEKSICKAKNKAFDLIQKIGESHSCAKDVSKKGTIAHRRVQGLVETRAEKRALYEKNKKKEKSEFDQFNENTFGNVPLTPNVFFDQCRVSYDQIIPESIVSVIIVPKRQIPCDKAYREFESGTDVRNLSVCVYNKYLPLFPLCKNEQGIIPVDTARIKILEQDPTADQSIEIKSDHKKEDIIFRHQPNRIFP